jgi:hypothetical protein
MAPKWKSWISTHEAGHAAGNERTDGIGSSGSGFAKAGSDRAGAAMAAEVSAKTSAVASAINLMPVLPRAAVVFTLLQRNSLKHPAILSSDLNMSRDMFLRV